MAISQISKGEVNRFFNEKYALVCQLLDCEAFQSWHTPSKSEWSDVLLVRRLPDIDERVVAAFNAAAKRS